MSMIEPGLADSSWRRSRASIAELVREHYGRDSIK